MGSGWAWVGRGWIGVATRWEAREGRCEACLMRLGTVWDGVGHGVPRLGLDWNQRHSDRVPLVPLVPLDPDHWEPSKSSNYLFFSFLFARPSRLFFVSALGLQATSHQAEDFSYIASYLPYLWLSSAVTFPPKFAFPTPVPSFPGTERQSTGYGVRSTLSPHVPTP